MSGIVDLEPGEPAGSESATEVEVTPEMIEAGTREILARAVLELAERLYVKSEMLAPGLGDNEPMSWRDLSEPDRNFYVSIIEDLARYKDCWDAIDTFGRPPRNIE